MKNQKINVLKILNLVEEDGSGGFKNGYELILNEYNDTEKLINLLSIEQFLLVKNQENIIIY